MRHAAKMMKERRKGAGDEVDVHKACQRTLSADPELIAAGMEPASQANHLRAAMTLGPLTLGPVGHSLFIAFVHRLKQDRATKLPPFVGRHSRPPQQRATPPSLTSHATRHERESIALRTVELTDDEFTAKPCSVAP